MSSHNHLGECRLCEMCNTCVGHPELPADPTYHFAIQGKHIHSHLACMVPRLCNIENVDESFFWSDRTRFNTYLVSSRDRFNNEAQNHRLQLRLPNNGFFNGRRGWN